MPDLAHLFIREPETQTPHQYAERVLRLAAAYLLLFTVSVVGIVLLLWQAQLFVTLSQRSNVETLVLAFLLVFFIYFVILSFPGAAGAIRIFWYTAQARYSSDPDAVERRKIAALGGPPDDEPSAVLNVLLECEEQPGQPFRIAAADGIGRAAVLEVDGANVQQIEAHRRGSNSLLGFFVRQTSLVLEERGAPRDIDIVYWSKIDDEAARRYISMVEFARNLERSLNNGPLWPCVTLTADDCRELERRLSAICPAIRNEAFLPDWEYSAEHKLPLIPEPLGLVSLSRSEQRADPVAAMGCAVTVVMFVVAVLGLFIAFPPWVPGS